MEKRVRGRAHTLQEPNKGTRIGDAMSTDTRSDARHVADSQDLIRVHGARVNNLKNVSVELPKRRLTVFTGVSGSGKSSLVFATIAAESQRLINETYSAFVQGFMPTLGRPEVDLLEGLTTAIIVDQERMGTNPRSTVGTATDANAMLRILFSRLGEPHIGSPNAYSFNVPSVRASGGITIERGGKTRTEKATFNRLGGMCPRCEGMGSITDFDLSALYDASKSLSEGALAIPGYSMDGWYGRIFSGAGLPMDKPIGKYTKKELHKLLYEEPTKIKVEGINLTYEGVIPKIQKSMLSKDVDALQPHVRAFVERAITFTTCPECDGTRLSAEARSSKIKGKNIADVCAMQISDLAGWIRDLDEPSVAPLLSGLQHLLDSFAEIGLGYLSLDRPAGTLSGGEAQRTKMIRHLGSSLTDVTYVFDEPSIGLHPHDIERMNELLLQLRDKGNTVLVVEHKPEMIAIADHVVDLGPGRVRAAAASASRAPSRACGRARPSPAVISTTGRVSRTRCARPPACSRSAAQSTHNLRDGGRRHPARVLCVVTGVAGSGKSSLIHGSVAGRDGVVAIDQGAIRGSRRSNPATYTGLLEPIRKAFAKANGVKPALFSANSEGACPTCNGPASSTPTWASWQPSSRRARSAGASGSRRRCWSTRSAAGTSPTCWRCRSPRRGSSSATARRTRRRRTRSSTGSPTSGWATSASASRSPLCRAASDSGSSWPPAWARRAASTCSTSRPPACTSPMSRSCSAYSTGSSTRVSR
jgi:excinuclease UvrABC ATPase subunit